MPAKIPREELLDELRRLDEELDSPPTEYDMANKGEYGAETYRRRFGSWPAARSEAELPDPSAHNRIPSNELLSELQRVAEEVGRSPTFREFRECGEYDGSIYADRFGSWEAAKEEAGLSELPEKSQKHISDEELTAELVRLGRELGTAPTKAQMNECGEYSVGPYLDRHEGWNDALRDAGFRPNSRNKIPRRELLEELERVADEIGHTPTIDELENRSTLSIGPFIMEFGTWNGAIEAVGLKPNHRNFVPDDELKDELRRLADELGSTPTAKEMGNKGRFSAVVYLSRFGSYNEAIKEVGLSPNRRTDIPSDEMLRSIQDLAESLGRQPTYDEMDSLGEFSTATFERRFGSWTDALIEAGFERRSFEGENNPAWKPETDTPKLYGKGWTEQKKQEIRKRDSYSCQDPTCQMDQKEHIRVYGCALHVHHLMTPESFDDKERANRPDNLVTLCCVCHRKWEQMAPLRPVVAAAD